MKSKYWNKIPKQRFLRGNKEGKQGDCWRCCIAAILKMPANKVPHFLQKAKDKGGSTVSHTEKWLNKHGYALIQIPFGQFVWDRIGKIPIMECGPTIRSEFNDLSEDHCVLTMNGKLIYDPHPSNAGLLATRDRILIVPIVDYEN